MSHENDGYSLKEVMEKNFVILNQGVSELKQNVSNGFTEVKLDVNKIRETANDAREKATNAEKRLDNYDKKFWALFLLILGCWIKSFI